MVTVVSSANRIVKRISETCARSFIYIIKSKGPRMLPWGIYYKLMHNDLPEYFSTMTPTLPTVCRRYEIRAPVFHLPVIRHTFAEHSIRFCLINLLNKDTRSTIIMERVDTDPYPIFKFYMKEQIFDSYQTECIIINCPVCRRLKINNLKLDNSE